MNKIQKFYAVATLFLAVFFVNAIKRTMASNDRFEIARIEQAEVLSYQECAKRYYALLDDYAKKPTSWKEYFVNLRRGNLLVDSSLRALRHPTPIVSAEDQRAEAVIHNIQREIQPWINSYANLANGLDSDGWQEANQRFEEIQREDHARVHVPMITGERILYWWAVFHVVGMLFIFIHYVIGLHARKMKVGLEPMNPKFWFAWVMWEVGIFIYPKKESPLSQLRRAQQWATLVLSSSLSCFAGVGKICQKKQEAPQHQQDDRPKLKWSLTEFTVSDYIGLDGGEFFPGAVQWTTLTAVSACGFYGSFSDAEPLTYRSLKPNFGRENDWTGGYGRNFGKFSLDANATYINASPLTRLLHGDVLQLSEKLIRNISLGKRIGIGPYVWLRQAVPIRGSTPVGGWFIHGGSTATWKFGERVSGTVMGEILHDSGAFGYKPREIGRASVMVNWKLRDHVSMQFPVVMFADPISHTHDGRRPQTTLGFGIAFAQ